MGKRKKRDGRADQYKMTRIQNDKERQNENNS